MELKDKLQLLRKQNGYSQEQLADKLGIARQTLSKWENGQSTPDATKMIKLAELLDTDLEYLATCRRIGKNAAAYYNWTVINCVRDGEMRTIEDIHEEIYRHVMACLED